jgi:peptide/nickel transport system permease protein
MTAYIARRLLQSVVTLFILSILFFLLARQNAGNPCATAGCTQLLHLDQPIANQYLTWISHIVHFDFGTSSTGDNIGSVILQKLPPTVLLVGVSLVIQQMIALPLGIFAALRPYSVLDQAFTFVSYVALSIPAFLLGFFLIYLFAVHWHVLPVAHYEDETVPLLWTSDWFSAVTSDPGYVLGDLVHHLLLPVFALTVTGIAVDSRFMRASMLQVLHQDYIRTAQAKGLKRSRVIFKHAFRNALLPIITNIGLYLPALLGGVVAVESVFSWGGLGYAFAHAIGVGVGPGVSGDFTFLEALAMLSAVAAITANLLADLAYAWLDPRIRYEAKGD